jgi:hypothetical protein
MRCKGLALELGVSGRLQRETSDESALPNGTPGETLWRFQGFPEAGLIRVSTMQLHSGGPAWRKIAYCSTHRASAAALPSNPRRDDDTFQKIHATFGTR